MEGHSLSYDPQRHHRHSIRLPGYNYADAGVIFVTVCTHQRENLFGVISEGAMVTNDVGDVVCATWLDLPGRFPGLILDAFVIMPNHMHGILIFPDLIFPEMPTNPTPSAILGPVLRAFKSISAVASNRLRELTGTPLWQRNYYEHIVRNETVLDKARHYIDDNPRNWDRDADNPALL